MEEEEEEDAKSYLWKKERRERKKMVDEFLYKELLSAKVAEATKKKKTLFLFFLLLLIEQLQIKIQIEIWGEEYGLTHEGLKREWEWSKLLEKPNHRLAYKQHQFPWVFYGVLGKNGQWSWELKYFSFCPLV